MTVCQRCYVDLPESHFKMSRSGVRNKRCLQCLAHQRAYYKEHYASDKSRNKPPTKESVQAEIERLQELLATFN